MENNLKPMGADTEMTVQEITDVKLSICEMRQSIIDAHKEIIDVHRSILDMHQSLFELEETREKRLLVTIWGLSCAVALLSVIVCRQFGLFG